MINVLNISYNIGLLPSLPIFESETENESEEINYQKIISDNTNLSLKKCNMKKYAWMKGACIDILVFVIKLYENVFVFDKDGNVEHSKTFKTIQKAKRMQQLINELIKEIDFKEKINVFSDDMEIKTFELFSFMYNKIYLGDKTE